MPRIRRALPLLLVGLAACTQFPELDDRVGPLDPRAPFPALVPVEPLVAQAQEVRVEETEQAALQARVAALNARADRLRRTVVDRDTRARMSRGVTR